MKKIIGVLKPFDIYQTFYVYEDGNKLEVTTTRIKDISDTIFQLSAKYDVMQIDLAGATYYAQGIAKQIQEKEMQKYNQSRLVIRCI